MGFLVFLGNSYLLPALYHPFSLLVQNHIKVSNYLSQSAFQIFDEYHIIVMTYYYLFYLFILPAISSTDTETNPLVLPSLTGEGCGI